MTLIVAHVERERVRIMTDSLAYTRQLADTAFVNKVEALPELGVIMAGQGSALIGEIVNHHLAEAVKQAHEPSFDELTHALPTFLPIAREAAEGLASWDIEPDQRFVAGYSERKKRFVVCRYVSSRGYRREYVDRFFMTPTPWAWRPDKHEADGVVRQVDDDAPRLQAFLREWRKAPLAPVPDSPDGWWRLAQEVWEVRSTIPFVRVPLAGEVHLHTLTKDGHTTQLLGELGTSPADAARMYQNTLHPQGQWAPCVNLDCESNGTVPFLDCCAREALDLACECGSGELFRDCHMVPRPEAAGNGEAPGPASEDPWPEGLMTQPA